MTSAAPTTPANGASGSLKGVIAAPTAICTIDGAEGRLIYRGYSIEDLTEHTTFEEVVYLLWEGDLPTRAQFGPFTPAPVRWPRAALGRHRSPAHHSAQSPPAGGAAHGRLAHRALRSGC